MTGHCGDATGETALGGDDRRQLGAGAPISRREELSRQLVLAAVMAIERALRNAGVSGDIGDRYAIDPARREEFDGGPIDPFFDPGGPTTKLL